MSELLGIGTDQIDEYWPYVKPFVDLAMRRSTTEITDQVYEALKGKSARLWLSVNDGTIQSVCIVQVSERPKNKICSIWICAGSNRKEWMQFIETIEAWAKSNGCTRMRHEARMGWARELKKYGYKTSHVIIEKGL